MVPNHIGWRLLFWSGIAIAAWNFYDGTYIPGLIPAVGCILILKSGAMKKGGGR